MAEVKTDRVLYATVQFNVEKPGRCSACKRQTQEHRAMRVGYVNQIPAAERERRLRAGETEQEIVISITSN